MTYPGGKNGSGVYQQIINQIPPHDCYIELFFGSGTIYRLKKLAGKSVGVDADHHALYEFGKNYPEHRRDIDLYPMCALDFLDDELPALSAAHQRVLIYADPPYLFEVRKTRKYYRREFGTKAEHSELVQRLRDVPENVKVILSGYPNAIYDVWLKDWRTRTFSAQTRGAKPATECIWMNYPEPSELHDYRYLGENFRERERIKRKKARWEAKLINMPVLERRAILAIINELREAGSL